MAFAWLCVHYKADLRKIVQDFLKAPFQVLPAHCPHDDVVYLSSQAITEIFSLSLQFWSNGFSIRVNTQGA